MTLKTVEIVNIYKTNVWIESDMMGFRHVVMQHETCHPFTYASFGYDYAYTSNAGTLAAAEKLARELGATDPIEHRHREIDFGGGVKA